MKCTFFVVGNWADQYPEQAKAMAAISDGAIVGSAIVKIIAEYGIDAAPYIGEYVKSMKEAVAEA